jgi:hypothetical protein
MKRVHDMSAQPRSVLLGLVLHASMVHWGYDITVTGVHVHGLTGVSVMECMGL